MKKVILALAALMATQAQAAQEILRYKCDAMCVVVGGDDFAYNSVAAVDLISGTGDTQIKAYNNMIRNCKIWHYQMNLRGSSLVIAADAVIRPQSGGEHRLVRYTEANMENTCLPPEKVQK